MKNTYLVCFSSNSGDNHCSFSSEKKARKYIAGELVDKQYTFIRLYKNKFCVQTWWREYGFGSYKTHRSETPVHYSLL